MYRFFVEPEAIDTASGIITITGEDVRHIRDVLRMRAGEQVLLCTAAGEDPVDYLCEISECGEQILTRIIEKRRCESELESKIYLFQALPKGDRMETVIQKSVELGVHAIVPIVTRRTIVKLDAKRAAKKTDRWNSISLAAAKQSKRGIIPKVEQTLSWKEALVRAKELDRILLPYENAEGMDYTRRVLSEIRPGESIGIFIGPEGGFEDAEVEELKNQGAKVISLGHRILRTDTAGPALIAALMLQLET